MWNHARPRILLLGVLGTHMRGTDVCCILCLRFFSRRFAVLFLKLFFGCTTFQGVHFGEHTCFWRVAFFKEVKDFASLVAIDDAAVPPFENLSFVK